MKVRVTNIQRFSLNDGPGIRTTVFLKGCNLKCPWCANPENIDFNKNEYVNNNTGEQGIFGYDIEPEKLLQEIRKDKSYYQVNQGGVTFSGGEPLLQIQALEPVLKKLKEENINMCIETALQVPNELVELAISYIDEFIVDIKILDKEENQKVLNGNVELYEKNLQLLTKKAQVDIFRIPLVNEYTLKEKNVEKILELLKKYKSNKVEIFKIHNLAESKYASLGKTMTKFTPVEDGKVQELYKKIKQLNREVEIIKI